MIDEFFSGRKVFITGHTGFKGTWLALWLHRLGANVQGFSLEPPSSPSLFDVVGLDELVEHRIGDVRDYEDVLGAMGSHHPEVVFHLAAQSLVREGYEVPRETFSTNVIGTVNVLEAARQCESVRAIVNVTSDKCYENRKWIWGYRERDRLGGKDPYSTSKACSELVSSAYDRSFFSPDGDVALASARAGNMLGGGDWASDRLIPDCVRALSDGRPIVLRNPAAVRPWQHVIEPLYGYLLLARELFARGTECSGPWNFGPPTREHATVEEVVSRICGLWGGGDIQIDSDEQPPETQLLRLDSTKAEHELGWCVKFDLAETLALTVDWYQGFYSSDPLNLRQLCLEQIDDYQSRVDF